jgi:hypothetical protein
MQQQSPDKVAFSRLFYLRFVDPRVPWDDHVVTEQ